MKTLGIVGGLGPESTIDYYRSIIHRYQELVADQSYPSIVIVSLDVTRARRLLDEGKLVPFTDYLVDAVRRLATAGADFGLLSANTAHLVFDEIRRRSPLPLISIVEATCDEAMRRGLKRLSLLGTRFTMQARFYPETFDRHGLTIVTPTEDEQAYIHEKYFSELLKAVFLPSTREGLQAIIAAQKERDNVDGVILGGTELPLILKEPSFEGLPLLDTTRIHVNAAVSEILK